MSEIVPPIREPAMQRLSVGPRLRPYAGVLAGLGFGLVAFTLLFLPEIKAAVATWNASTAYGHCYLVLPMTLYLLWERREVIAVVKQRAEPALALLAVPIAIAWFVAERLGIMEGRQLMAVAGLEVLLLAVLGRRLFWELSGPLLFLVFLVPFGAFLTPFLQRFTASFTVAGLNVLGIPNYADDFVIEIPQGTFFVAEACAGLRFLIAAVAFGVFYALLNYRSPRRRAAFMLASVVVPIIANGFRALGIVVLGYILGSAEAAAADHVIYGWVFFSIVMLLLVAGGMPLRERLLPPPPRPGDAILKQGPFSPIAAALAAVLCIGIGPAMAGFFNVRATAAPLAGLPQFELPVGCLAEGSGPAKSSMRIGAKLACGGFAFDVAVQTFPGRATPSSLVAERRRATGELSAEDTTYIPLFSGAGQGDWTLVQTIEPFRTTALATWVRGRPAPTGLSGRLEQARDSMFGTDHAVVLITITSNNEGRLSPERQRQLVAALRSFVAAQTELTARIDVLSRGD